MPCQRPPVQIRVFMYTMFIGLRAFARLISFVDPSDICRWEVRSTRILQNFDPQSRIFSPGNLDIIRCGFCHDQVSHHDLKGYIKDCESKAFAEFQMLSKGQAARPKKRNDVIWRKPLPKQAGQYLRIYINININIIIIILIHHQPGPHMPTC